MDKQTLQNLAKIAYLAYNEKIDDDERDPAPYETLQPCIQKAWERVAETVALHRDLEMGRIEDGSVFIVEG